MEGVMDGLQKEVDLINSYSGPSDQSYVKGLQKAMDALREATEYKFKQPYLDRAAQLSVSLRKKIKDRKKAKDDSPPPSRYEEDWNYKDIR